MITVSDINKLISQWTKRMSDSTYPQAYRDALFECCFDLHKLVEDTIEQEINTQAAGEKHHEAA